MIPKAHRQKQVSIKELKPFEGNPRTITREMMNKLCQSIEEEGFLQPIVCDENFRVLGGWQRLRAAKKLKLKEVPVIQVDCGGDEQRAKVINLRLNKIHGEFDYEALYKFLEDVDVNIIGSAGFDAEEIDEIMKALNEADQDLQESAEESVERAKVSFEADASKSRCDFKFGSFRTKVAIKNYDRFNQVFDTLLSQKVVQDEASFVAWVVGAAVARMKRQLNKV